MPSRHFNNLLASITSLTCALLIHYLVNAQTNRYSLFTLCCNTGTEVAWILQLLIWKQEPDAHAAAGKFRNKFLPCCCIDYSLRNACPDDFATTSNSHVLDLVEVACLKHELSLAVRVNAPEPRSSRNCVVMNTGTLFAVHKERRTKHARQFSTCRWSRPLLLLIITSEIASRLISEAMHQQMSKWPFGGAFQ